jgi:hypothetical protein
VMRLQTVGSPQASEFDLSRSEGHLTAPDGRFAVLLGAAAWRRLPSAVRQRFSKALGSQTSVTYAGEIVECRRTRLGKLLATLCRLIGAPLPLHDHVGVPAAVTIFADGATGGQHWTRIYGRPRGFPQVIHSTKRFAGPTGLEEYLGCGFGVALTVSTDAQALHFHSDHYFFALGAVRQRLPHWLGPGALTVSHVERGGGYFAFVLTLRHPRFGEIIRQTGVFQECSLSHLYGDVSGVTTH